MRIVRRILKEVWKSKKTVLFLIFLTVIVASLDVITPLIAQNLIDQLVKAFSSHTLLPLAVIIFSAVGILIVTLLGRAIGEFTDYRLFIFVTQLEDRLRFLAYETYLSLHVLYHHETNSGQIIGRIDRGCTGVYTILHEIIGKFLIKPFIIVLAVAVVLFWKDSVMALIIILPLPIFIASLIPLSRKIYDADKKADNAFDRVTREEYDVAGNVLTVKNFAQEKEETGRQKQFVKEGREFQYRAERLWKLSGLIQTSISTVARVSIIVVGGYFTLISRATVGEFVLYITLQNMVYEPLWQLAVLFAILRRHIIRAERLFTIIDEKVHVKDRDNALVLPAFHNNINFKNVAFSYRAENELLRDITVTIPAAATVALVGRSGSGKSTFVNLLLRSFDPQKGEIFIDGYDLRDVTQKSLRSQIAIVSQDVELFSRSIARNIAYGKPFAAPKQISDAARLAFAHDFIMKTKDGYESLVGERGIKLSGGERQRVGIARAILQNPRILILDEATSHLDTESERFVQKATKQLMEGRTTVIIAHRLSTILHADKILVFDKGRIIDEGKHHELLERCEVYRKLYKLQFQEQ